MRATEIPATLLGIVDPFPGLRAFGSDEEAIFRGRRKQADELLRRLAGHRFLAVVGTSGSGKSSLVKAGLLPALDRGYLAGATSRWRVALMRPGMAPIDNLAEALRGRHTQQASIDGADVKALRSSSLGLVEVVQNAQLAPGESLLIVADQFEELFRYHRRMNSIDGGGDAALFVNLLLTAARRPDAPVYVVLTMRSDFLGDCAQFSGLPEALSESQYLIPRLTREQRRQAIVEPLRLFGAAMTPQLVEQLLNDSGDEPTDPAVVARYRGGAADPLPVLQHALMRTYLAWKSLSQERVAEPIDLPWYRSAGCMEAALNQHAEHLFTEELDDDRRRWVERIFRCLTTTELGRPVRRPTLLADLYRIVAAGDGDRKKIDAVLDLFRRRENSFIQLNRDGSVDISHESLIWKWKRLSVWVAEEAASAELYRDLVKDASGEAPWSEPKLSAALSVRRKNGWNSDWARQYTEDRFHDVEVFLVRSQKAARNQKWLRWFGVAAAPAVIVLAILAYSSMLQTRHKATELEASEIAKRSLAGDLEKRRHDQDELEKMIAELKATQGSTQEGRDHIAALEEQLGKSQQDSQKLAQSQQSSTDLVVTVRSLQSRLVLAQRERDDAVKALADAAEKRQNSPAKPVQPGKSAEVDRVPEATAVITPPQETAPDPPPNSAASKPVGVSAASKPVAETRWVNPRDRLAYLWIHAGNFIMGCSPGDNACEEIEKPPHSEQIAKGFWLGQTEVSQAAWKKVKGNNPSRFKDDQLPVEYVDWNQAAAYCNAIGGRLPTEAEWEYAARAGTTGARYGPIDAIAWFHDNSGSVSHHVGSKQPNAFGLNDMLGNVWEWTDSSSDRNMKVLRGGSWDYSAERARASSRYTVEPGFRGSYIGFRCVDESR